MKILYDVAAMAQLAAACQSANDELQKAQSLVMEVQFHSDWTCKEKNTIDDLMRECKKRIQGLCEDEKGFLRAVRQSAEDLTDAEKNVSALFGSVESLLGKILAIPVKTATVFGQNLLERIGMRKPDANTGLNSWAKGVEETVRTGLGKVDELRREQIVQKYDPQFSRSGTLYWPESEEPPLELVEALGGTYVYNMTTSQLVVTWPWMGADGRPVAQVFGSARKPWSDITDNAGPAWAQDQKWPDISAIFDKIQVVSCSDLTI